MSALFQKRTVPTRRIIHGQIDHGSHSASRFPFDIPQYHGKPPLIVWQKRKSALPAVKKA